MPHCSIINKYELAILQTQQNPVFARMPSTEVQQKERSPSANGYAKYAVPFDICSLFTDDLDD
jgi:hypothetical protein